MISGGHIVVFSTDPEADRKFFRDLLGLANVDAGGGWLIFGLPPSEIAVHPSDRNNVHEFYLMCTNIDDFISEMRKQEIDCEEVHQESWGLLTRLTLPGGGKLGVYQPHHPRPQQLTSR